MYLRCRDVEKIFGIFRGVVVILYNVLWEWGCDVFLVVLVVVCVEVFWFFEWF